ncbi:NADP-dependent malic enzyme [Methanolobus sp.]|jgi:malate dehydrogenase (oxaloacetate-decarboxylating)|uniref:NAD(P)-dependent malic enzyme n=1 Tax=Methanolobus sp. TaxID=1874737 RepID=UPI0025DBD871|nr:NADP-dependent malic enzyme [Methanolobus sp.]
MDKDPKAFMCKAGDSTLGERSLELHESAGGVIGICGKVPLDNIEDLSLVYTPGVAESCKRIAANQNDIYRYTMKKNSVAVISDGSAVLGLGNIGAYAALPVMEGKALIFKELAGIDAFPVCLDTNDTEEIIKTVKHIAPAFGGINLEDISAPRCFEIEERLRNELPIPVFHDDQHGTAVVVIAGLINALKIVDKKIQHINVVISGAGAAGKAIALKLMYAGVSAEKLVVCDSRGVIHKGRKIGMNKEKEEIASLTNKKKMIGTLADALIGADVFIGVSAPGIVSVKMVSSMASDAIIFAMANPIPEIMPFDAKKAGARVVATGRSDCPNQVNNCLGFPGIFRGALDTRASNITLEMEMAAVFALADIVTDEELNENYIIPAPLDKRVVEAVSLAVSSAAIKDGVARTDSL